MLKDRTDNLSKYIVLDESLSSFSPVKAKEIVSFSDFVVDKEHSVLFFVDCGEVSFATSWRENELNREVLAVMRAGKGEFVLYLPGEPYLVKCDENASVRYWSLG